MSNEAGHPTFLVVLAGPSGAGKTSIGLEMVKRDESVRFSISATTRPKREGEEDGVHYFFIDDARFERMRQEGQFVEWAEVHGHRYGTPRSFLDECLARGETVLLDIDVQGAEQIHQAFPDAIMIFVAPPSMEALEKRLRTRGTEAEEVLVGRMGVALDEMKAMERFTHVVVNDVFARATGVVQGIIEAERCRVERLKAVGLMKKMLNEFKTADAEEVSR